VIQDKDLQQKEEGENIHSEVNAQGINVVER